MIATEEKSRRKERRRRKKNKETEIDQFDTVRKQTNRTERIGMRMQVELIRERDRERVKGKTEIPTKSIFSKRGKKTRGKRERERDGRGIEKKKGRKKGVIEKQKQTNRKQKKAKTKKNS